MAYLAAARMARLSFMRAVLFWRRPSSPGRDRKPLRISVLSEHLRRDVGL
jgi:hypothetical protein